MYADVDGDIGWVAGGAIPMRKNAHHGLLPVPGWSGDWDWQGYLPVKDMPQSFNPSRHWLATANHNILPKGYPHQIAYEWAPPHRFLRIEQRLSEKKQFTLEDFLGQIEQMKRMGPLEDMLKMLPGVGGKLKGLSLDDRALARVQAMIQSMTPEERRNPSVLNGSRRRRVALGSGTTVQELNQLLKQFRDMQKMMRMLKGRRGLGRVPMPF